MKGVTWASAVSDHPQATAEDAKRIVTEQLREADRIHNQRFDNAVLMSQGRPPLKLKD